MALNAYTLYPRSIAYGNRDAGELKNLSPDAKTIVGLGRSEKSLLLIRQEAPDKRLLESVD